MREIKFRGKRLDNGEWVCGFPIILLDKSLIAEESGNNNPLGEHTYKSWRVDPATAGQYTGLKDKNGKEIYEGDILRARLFNYVVKWNKELATWYCDPIPKEHVITTTKTLFEVAEIGVVVGNIYENPELLEGSE